MDRIIGFVVCHLIVLVGWIPALRAQAFYTIIDDDILSTKAISGVKKLADEKGVKISFAVTAGKLLKDKELTDSLLSFQKQGFHICNHGWTHSSEVWKDPTWNDIKGEIGQSKSLLDSLGFRNADYFVYPFGKYSESCIEQIQSHIADSFQLAFNSRGYYTNLNAFNRYYIERFPIRKHNHLWVVRLFIDEAAKENGWIVFLSHSGKRRDHSLEYLGAIIDYCNNKGLQALTVDEAYHRLKREGILDDDSKSMIQVSGPGMWQEIFDFLMMHILWVLGFSCLLIMIVWGLTRKNVMPSISRKG